MEVLPLDIVPIIFFQLGDKDLCSWGRTSKTINMMYFNPHLWIKKILAIYPTVKLTDAFPISRLIRIYRSIFKRGNLYTVTTRIIFHEIITPINISGDIIQVGVGNFYLAYLTMMGELFIKENSSSRCRRISVDDKFIIQVAAGPNHTAILTDEGEVYVFGGNKYGELGMGDNIYRDTFTKIPGYNNVVQISCGSNQTALVTSWGELYVCGYNVNGELGFRHCQPVTRPAKVVQVKDERKRVIPLINQVTEVSCGNNSIIFLTTEGIAYSFNGIMFAQIPKITNIKTVQSGNLRQLILTQENRAYTISKSIVELVPNIVDVKQISTCPKDKGCLITKYGNLYIFATLDRNNIAHTSLNNGLIKFAIAGPEYIAYIE